MARPRPPLAAESDPVYTEARIPGETCAELLLREACAVFGTRDKTPPQSPCLWKHLIPQDLEAPFMSFGPCVSLPSPAIFGDGGGGCRGPKCCPLCRTAPSLREAESFSLSLSPWLWTQTHPVVRPAAPAGPQQAGLSLSRPRPSRRLWRPPSGSGPCKGSAGACGSPRGKSQVSPPTTGFVQGAGSEGASGLSPPWAVSHGLPESRRWPHPRSPVLQHSEGSLLAPTSSGAAACGVFWPLTLALTIRAQAQMPRPTFLRREGVWLRKSPSSPKLACVLGCLCLCILKHRCLPSWDVSSLF